MFEHQKCAARSPRVERREATHSAACWSTMMSSTTRGERDKGRHRVVSLRQRLPSRAGTAINVTKCPRKPQRHHTALSVQARVPIGPTFREVSREAGWKTWTAPHRGHGRLGGSEFKGYTHICFKAQGPVQESKRARANTRSWTRH